MAVALWDDILSDEDRQVVDLGGYGKLRGFGESPAILVIDVQYFMVGEDEPILVQIERFPSGCGERAWQAVRHMVTVLKWARVAEIPIVYVRTALRHSIRFYWSAHKTARDHTRYMDGHPDTEIVREVAPLPSDPIVEKSFPDAFLGTPLQAILNSLGVDTLILVGGSASGCVRATATTAASLNYRVSLIEECVFDRLDISHKIALFDFWRSLGDVVSKHEVEKYFRSLTGERIST